MLHSNRQFSRPCNSDYCHLQLAPKVNRGRLCLCVIAYKYACPHNANIHRVIDKRSPTYAHIAPHRENQTGVTLRMTRICNSLATPATRRTRDYQAYRAFQPPRGVTASSRIPRRDPSTGSLRREFQGECQTRAPYFSPRRRHVLALIRENSRLARPIETPVLNR